MLVTSTRKMFTIAISFLFISRKAFTGKHFVGLLLAVTGAPPAHSVTQSRQPARLWVPRRASQYLPE